MGTKRTEDARFYTAYGYEKASPVFAFVKDLTLNNGSGAWRALQPSDFTQTLSGDVQVDFGSLTEISTGQLEQLVFISGISEQVEENTRYQDVPFNQQTIISDSAQQLAPYSNKGWATISIDADGSDSLWVGDVNVTSGNGYRLNASMPSVTISSDNLGEWYGVGPTGGATAYVLGAYVSN